jgi:hypothetical protein
LKAAGLGSHARSAAFNSGKGVTVLSCTGWAKQLGLKPGSDDWLIFFEYAAADAGRIPDHILKNTELAAHRPAYLRTLSGQRPSREDLEELLGIVKGTLRP